MATNIVQHDHSPKRFTAADLTACELTEKDGLQVEADGGVSFESFLIFFKSANVAAADFFTGENESDITAS